MGLVLALLAAAGAYYAFTGLVLGWRGLGLGPAGERRLPGRPRTRDWLIQAGLGEVRVREFAVVTGVVAVSGAALGALFFGAALPGVVAGACAGLVPFASFRARRQRRLSAALQAWPRLIEEIRITTAGLGRSIPQALFEAGRTAPETLRPAFDAAHREWLLSTDFARATAILKARLADPTADATCETLLVAHEVGGSDLDRRLAALVEDRILDVQSRRDARARQAGVRFTRRFVLLVPAGMAAVGTTIGPGRAAYATGRGQMLVALGIVAVAGCWLWAGRLLKLPEEQRVFDEEPRH